MNKKIDNLIGLSFRAKKLRWGEENCLQEIKRGRAILIIISSDASENTKNKFLNLSRSYDCKIIEYGTKLSNGMNIGKSIISVMVMLDDGLSKKILSLVSKNNC